MSNVDLMNSLTSRMQWLADRQQILTQNITNADTPGYRAMELHAPSFKQAMQKLQTAQMVQTNPMHMSSLRQSSAGTGKYGINRNPSEVYPTGNTVNLEDETRKAAQNVMDYELITNIYKKESNMILTAAGRPR